MLIGGCIRWLNLFYNGMKPSNFKLLHLIGLNAHLFPYFNIAEIRMCVILNGDLRLVLAR